MSTIGVFSIRLGTALAKVVLFTREITLINNKAFLCFTMAFYWFIDFFLRFAFGLISYSFEFLWVWMCVCVILIMYKCNNICYCVCYLFEAWLWFFYLPVACIVDQLFSFSIHKNCRQPVLIVLFIKI